MSAAADCDGSGSSAPPSSSRSSSASSARSASSSLLSVADDDPDEPASVGSWARFADLGESDGPPESADDCEDEFDSDDPDVESADIPCSIHFPHGQTSRAANYKPGVMPEMDE